MSTLALDISGTAIAGLDRIVEKLVNPQSLFDDIGGTLEANVNLRFDTKRDPNGNAWAELARSTQRAYDRADTVTRGRGDQKTTEVKRKGSLLERTRIMRQSLTSQVSDAQVEVGFAQVRAIYHELGTATMPRRGLLFGDAESATLGESDRNDVERLVESYLVALLE